MKFTLLTKNFQQGLNIVKNIIGKNLNLPILSSVLLTVKNNQINLSATNLEIGINYFGLGNIEQEGKVAVPVKIFSDFISNIKDEKINFNLKDNILNIQTDFFKTKIICFDPKDFPLIPKIKENLITVVPPKLLKNALTSVFDSVSLSQTRPELGGVFLNFDKSKIYLASTDSFRLSEKIINQNNQKSISVIVPKNTIAELIRILSDIEKDISIHVEENQIQFSSDNFEILSRLIEGRYPDYQKVIPPKSISQVLLNKEELQNQIRLAGFFTSNINDIGLKVDRKEITVFAKSSEKGEFSSKIKNNQKPSKYEIEEPFEVLLNYNYVNDGLKNMNSENVLLEYAGEGAPVVIKPGDKELNFTYLIMPLKT